MSKSPVEYIQHILDEITFLDEESSKITEEEFMRDEVRERAFSRSLEIIGEAVKMVPKDVTEKYPEIDWRSLAGLRDKLIHHYFGVDYAIVWDVVIHELPTLRDKFQKMLQELEK